ncbi:YdbL family protein [Nitrincola tapanii]|uniref:DUF1318 domain-containing protein n=1 Tax=Nitrincola tapanii TaxID=1708751 RepID=A0A5A9W3Q0_9GAMM|nr:YdbL family protein [Nitrincola tapanii]KAA0874181.1 DUF1318 domain-containing protein [Nitrincola tapanii]
MKSISRFSSIVFLFLALAFSGSAAAMSLEQAKTQGLVGEQLNGYVGIVSRSVTPELRNLINDVNSQRRALYQRSAQEAAVGLDVFEARAGQRLQQRAKPGEFIQDTNGQWKRK